MSSTQLLAAAVTATPVVLPVGHNNVSDRLTSKSSYFASEDDNGDDDDDDDDKDEDERDDDEEEDGFSFASGSTRASTVKASNLSEHVIAMSNKRKDCLRAKDDLKSLLLGDQNEQDFPLAARISIVASILSGEARDQDFVRQKILERFNVFGDNDQRKTEFLQGLSTNMKAWSRLGLTDNFGKLSGNPDKWGPVEHAFFSVYEYYAELGLMWLVCGVVSRSGARKSILVGNISLCVVDHVISKETLQNIFTGFLGGCTGRTTATELMENVNTWQNLATLHSKEHVREALATVGTFADSSSWEVARKQLTRPRGYLSSPSSAGSAKAPPSSNEDHSQGNMDGMTAVDEESLIDLVLPAAVNRASGASRSAEEKDEFQGVSYDGDSEWSPLGSNCPSDNPGHSHDEEDHYAMDEWGVASSTDSIGNGCCGCFVRVFRSPEDALKITK